MKIIFRAVFLLLVVSACANVKDDFVLVKGGTFIMGSDDRQYADSDEYYPHQVTLDSFYIDKFETTIKSVADVYNYALKKKYIYVKGSYVYIESNDKILLQVSSNLKTKSIKFEQGRFYYDDDAANYPIIHISWFGAAAYCNFLSEMKGLQKCYDEFMSECDFSKNGYRLLTEAEWEYAGKSGGKPYMFSWGNDIKKPKENVADLSFKKAYPNLPAWENYRDNFVHTSPVGSFTPNELGLYDISGNVYEWCWNWSTDNYEEKPVKNPRGPETGVAKALRGGSWYDTINLNRLSNRTWLFPQSTGTVSDVGVRIGRSKVK